MRTQERLVVKFDVDSESDTIAVTTGWDLNTVDPLLVVKALRDLADEEEKSYLTWVGKHDGLRYIIEAIQDERNRIIKSGVN